MLGGLTVNNGIYLLGEFSHERRYLKAYNHKIIPILLTVISTVIGLLPFLFDGQQEQFWFTFAASTIIGLLFSIFAVVFVMPLLMKVEHKPVAVLS